ncbi:cyclophilin-like fold protein [Pseudomonas benzopyrenica]|uniref:cyclophilin-like fold protein n=1 Tax=Pseudomonas benzopyrenica TaxID=2993566 RepID=UPI0039C30732
MPSISSPASNSRLRAAASLFMKAASVTYSLATEQDTSRVKLRLHLPGNQIINATVEDNATSRDFLALLPLALTLEDYHATEKIADLPSRLNTAHAPAGTTPAPGDITYYAPWGNLAIFYRRFPYSAGLVRLGRLEGELAPLQRSGPLDIRIVRADP